MNKDKILDEMFEYFEGTRDNFDIDMVEEFLESYEPQETLIQDIHERLTRIENRKEILLSALKSNNEDREELACFFVDTNALDFFSVDEINRLLNSNELKNSPLEKVRGSLIGASGNIEKYLAPEYVKAVGLDEYSVSHLIEKSGNIEKYLAPEYVKVVGLGDYSVANLIEKSGNIEKYLAPEYIKAVGLNNYNVKVLIEKSGNIEKYLTPEYIRAVGLDEYSVSHLIEKSGNIEKYLAPEYVKAVGFDKGFVQELIKASGNIEKYLAPEYVKVYGLRGINILYILGVNVTDMGLKLDNMIDNDQYTSETHFHLIKICNLIRQSNSGRLNRIASNVIENILTKPVDEQLDAANEIIKIYETTNIPGFAKDFMVFAKLNSAFLKGTELMGNVPSLNRATPTQRKNIIFSDLLRISIESNNRNLREYLNNIEQGDKLFEMFKAGNLQIDSTLPEESRVILKKYCNMLNTLYNQTSRGRRLDNARINSGNLAQDLTELNDLFTNEENIHIPLRDRIVRTFGYWAGIRSFEQAKKMMEENTKEADRRNRETAKKGDFSIRKGDFTKGIRRSEYFPSMLQNGIVAKDYLGQSSDSDYTPLDTDVESVEADEEMFTAPKYTDNDEDGRKLGKIILIIKKDERYVETRTNDKVDEEAINTVINNKQKIEYFDNSNVVDFLRNSYGIRTGIASTNISFIVADKYVDKLGLEIAMNGFYIPVVDSDKNLLYTPEMYDNIRSKMQGLSHYGLTEFQLDPSAWNIGISQITHVIEQSKEDANDKRKLILQTLKSAVETYGLNMSEKMTEDILQGTVEIIDTGSTGRGTNLPGDGDFDFMVRLDKNILTKPEEFKQLITDAVCSLDKPNESVTTGKGDFRFKGVSIAGIKEKVDLDLSFTPRTDEIEYTTEECINDRLETIKRSNPEEYKCVVANIILAKTVLKSAGAYKRKNAPAPINGEKDTRGGLGAVGIENWVLQNGGSFEKAARGFLEVSKQCEGLSEFRQRYAIWDFGENYMAGDNYPHDNFVDNMDDNGYSAMVNALEDYIKTIENERKIETQKKGIGDLVQEDMSALNDTPYMMAVARILESARRMERKELVSK